MRPIPPAPTQHVSVPRYGAQLSTVKLMLPLLGGLLQAGSEVDDVVSREVATLPEGLVFGMSAFGTDVGMRLRKEGSRLVLLDPKTAPPATLEIVFKHVSAAFLVVTFQESTALAFARARMVVHGDTALAVRLTRCMDRMEAITLPGPIAARALKAVPTIPLSTKLSLAARYYAALARNTARGPAA